MQQKKSTIQTMIKINHLNYWLIISNHIILDVNIYFTFVKVKKKLNKKLQYRRFNPLGMKQSLISVEFRNTCRYYHTVFPIKSKICYCIATKSGKRETTICNPGYSEKGTLATLTLLSKIQGAACWLHTNCVFFYTRKTRYRNQINVTINIIWV